MRSNLTHPLLGLVCNALLFQSVWWAAVLGYLGWAVLALALLLVQACLWRPNALQLPLLLLLAVVGLTIDTIWLWLSWYQSQPKGEILWLVMIWVAFTLTLTRSLWSLIKRRYLWMIFCGLFGPLAYYAGSALGRLYIDPVAWPAIALQWIAFGWLSHYVLAMNDKLSGVRQ